jgi:hypothetical protein
MPAHARETSREYITSGAGACARETSREYITSVPVRAGQTLRIPSMELCQVLCVIACISIGLTEVETVDIPPEWRRYLEKLVSCLT